MLLDKIRTIGSCVCSSIRKNEGNNISFWSTSRRYHVQKKSPSPVLTSRATAQNNESFFSIDRLIRLLMNTRDDSMHVYVYKGVLDYFGQSHMTSVTKRWRVIIDEARATCYSVVLLLFADASSDLKRVVDRDIQRYSNCPIRRQLWWRIDVFYSRWNFPLWIRKYKERNNIVDNCIERLREFWASIKSAKRVREQKFLQHVIHTCTIYIPVSIVSAHTARV